MLPVLGLTFDINFIVKMSNAEGGGGGLSFLRLILQYESSPEYKGFNFDEKFKVVLTVWYKIISIITTIPSFYPLRH